MNLDTFGDILLYGFFGLLGVVLTVVWVAIIVVVWVAVQTGLKQYRNSARELAAEEARRKAAAAQNPDFIDE